MKVFESIILGITQGLTEFLPVSSSGHLVLIQNIFSLQNDVIFFDCILHLATLLAVIIIYKNTLLKILKNPFSKLTFMLIVATIPTVIIGLVFNDFFENMFSGEFLYISFLVTAVILLFAEYCQKHNRNPQNMDYKKALITGIFQGIAIMPGISRSGTTISACLVQGVEKEEATEFSFLLSMPVILGSTILEFFKLDFQNIFGNISFSCYILGFITSFIFGMISIKFMLKIVKKNRYYIFSIYLTILAFILILNKFLFFF